MKIGILTYHRAYNYGAFLQAYALKSYIEDMGHNVSFIDYWPLLHENIYRHTAKNDGIRSFIRNMLLTRKRALRYRQYKLSLKKYLGISGNPIRTPDKLQNIEYDLIIYGSDQIWWKDRLESEGFDLVYWGQHVSNSIRKVSYAASMGVIDLTEKDKTQIKEYLKSFSAISVRETRLQEVLQPLTNKPIKTVLDPTLLLPKAFWDAFCNKKRLIKNKYILYYKVMNDDKADALARDMGKKHQLPVITLVGQIGSYKTDRINSNTGPREFVTLIRDAEYVVSTSFHGVAMSIQFSKEFYAMGMRNNSDRVLSLLTQLGIKNRLIESVPTDFSETIDYSIVHSRLSFLRNDSSVFLKESIQS